MIKKAIMVSLVILWSGNPVRPQVKHLLGHRSVWSVAFSPDGTMLAVANAEIRDNTIQVWDVASGKLLADLKGHPKVVYMMSWSDDGATLVATCTDQRATFVKEWNIDTKKAKNPRYFYGNKRLALSRDSLVVTVNTSQPKIASVINLKTAKAVAVLKNHHFLVEMAAISPDEKLVATRDSSHVRVWDTKGANIRWKYRFKDWRGRLLFFTQVGKSLVFQDYAARVLFFDAKTGKKQQPIVLGQRMTRWFQTTPDGRCLLSLFGKDDIDCWSVKSGKKIATFKCRVPFIGVKAMTISPDGRYLAIGLTNGSVIVWQVPDLQKLEKHFDAKRQASQSS